MPDVPRFRVVRRFLRNWRYSRGYGGSRRESLRIALTSLRRDFGATDEDLVNAYRQKWRRS